VTGEREDIHGPGPQQPGGRPPAPGALALLQAFVNTHFDLEDEFGAEVLHSPEALAAWLHRRGLLAADVNLEAVDLERGLELRESLRSLAAGDTTQVREHLETFAADAPIHVSFSTGRPVLHGPSRAGFPEAVGGLLAICAQAMLDGHWSRLKVCPGHHCGWLFYDHSRNRSGRWCSMAVCGGREKARAHYRRRQEA